jgi:polyisoprenoid-binding protein YceI
MPPSLQGSFKLVGDLTIRNVTKQVTWEATCQVQNSQAEGTCHATTSFTLEYFNLSQPQVARVLSIVDNITLEVDLDLKRINA